MTSTKLKVAIYCRLSEEDRDKHSEADDSNSIQNQKSLLIQHAIDQNWEIYNIYSDDDYTGSDRNRPEFKKMLIDAEQRKFNIILCKNQARFTRELELVEKYLHGLLPLWGIRFISIVDNADTANKGNKKSRQINGLVNEWYLEDMSENIKSVLVDRRRNGYHIGAFALYGYKKDPEQKGHLLIDHEAAAVVLKIFTLFSQGYGKTAISHILNDSNIPNPMEYKRLHGLRYKSPDRPNCTLWNYSTIASMLKNEIYIGNMVQGKYGSVSYKTKKNRPKPKEEWLRVEGTHEPIISHELWNSVQTLINQKAKPFKVGTIGLFAQKARCMNCNYTMRSTKAHNRHYLKCSSRHKSKDACIGAFIPVEKLEQVVIAELRKLSAEYLDKDELERKVEFQGNLISRKKEIESEIVTLQKKNSEYTKGIKSLYLDKVKGILTEAYYVELSKDFSSERDRLETAIVEKQKQLTELENKMQIGDNRSQLIEQYTNIRHLDRQTVEKLIDFILIGKKDPVTKEVPIEIHWTF